MPDRTPMRWPSAWQDPSALSLLKGTAIRYLLLESGAGLGPVAERARREGLETGEGAPPGVRVVNGEWPGVRLSRSGGGNRADAGPTGVPWVDSNGWRVRLEAALHPGSAVWVEAAPQDRLSPEAYAIAVADAAAPGGRWIVSLDSQLAAALAGQKPEAVAVWTRLASAAGFFAARRDWAAYVPQAVLGVVSDFAGQNEFFSHELLNLTARINQQYLVIPKDRAAEASFRGLRAVFYADAEPPAPDLRKRLLAFVEAGGLLITGPRWGAREGAPAKGDEHPRFAVRVLGRGRIAAAKADLSDPYLAANDAAVLISHRYDLLRFWNAGAVSSYLSAAPDRKRALAQMVFYAAVRGAEASVRAAGAYRTARLWTLDHPGPRAVEELPGREAIEIHLPPVSVYAGIELEA